MPHVEIRIRFVDYEGMATMPSSQSRMPGHWCRLEFCITEDGLQHGRNVRRWTNEEDRDHRRLPRGDRLVTDGVLATTQHGPADMNPILEARTGTRLLPGVHRFQLHWVVLRGLRHGASRQLSAECAWNAGVWPPGEEEGIVDELNVQGDSGS
jgi:hypothetical protein